MTLVLINAQLIDGVRPSPMPDARVTVEDGRIAEGLNGHGSPATHGHEVIDLPSHALASEFAQACDGVNGSAASAAATVERLSRLSARRAGAEGHWPPSCRRRSRQLLGQCLRRWRKRPAAATVVRHPFSPRWRVSGAWVME
jgi:hypothetical protein